MTITFKSHWQYIILLVIIARISIIYWPSTYPENSDVESAIKRAKTDSCKIELREFSYTGFKHKTRIHLKRKCNLDSNLQRNLKVGCALNSTESYTKLDDQVANSTQCLETCFNYGHSHAGFNIASRNCFCGDDASLRVTGQEVECYGQDWMEWYKVDNGIYKPTLSPVSTNEEELSGTNKVKIAFLLALSGRNVLQVKRLLRNIYSTDHVYYLHIDKRDNYLFKSLKKLEDDYGNIILTESRFNTIWGGPSLLRMLIDAMSRLAVYEWDYLINLSESDFPIKPLSELETFLNSDIRLIYLKTHNIKGYNFIKKQGLDKSFYQCEDRVWRLGNRSLPTGIIYSGGSDWFALPRDFCTYITRHKENPGGLVSPLLKIYNNTLLPAESFFHTLALNSEFCGRFADRNLRVTNWHRQKGCKCQHQDIVDWCGCSPRVYRFSDEQKLRQTKLHKDLFFARKFDSTISSSILNILEDQLNIEPSDYSRAEENDTRTWVNIYDSSEELKTKDGYLVVQQFGLFALNQSRHLEDYHELQSVDLYFNEDKFVGFVYKYCRLEIDCIQILVERQTIAHLRHHDTSCVKLIGVELNAIEVNHGFDISERMFRDYRPLSITSDVVVYHEWFLVNQHQALRNVTANGGVRFSWINPQGGLELAQKIRFKKSNKPVRISLAHRLAITKPLLGGLWTLSITNKFRNCFEYQFIVFDETSFVEGKISQKQFNRLYQVTNICSHGFQNHTKLGLGNDTSHCVQQLWSPSTGLKPRSKVNF